MGAPEGNQFWKLRTTHGREKLFASPELLWEEACKYFQWCENNPFKEQKLFSFQGKTVTGEVNKMRAYTMNGLCLFLGCSESYFRKFKANLKGQDENEKEASDDSLKQDFFTVIEMIESVIYEQKFTGAAADLLNANIISRDLGLKDSMSVTNEVPKPEPKHFVDYDDE